MEKFELVLEEELKDVQVDTVNELDGQKGNPDDWGHDDQN
jgi:hypothetical protein